MCLVAQSCPALFNPTDCSPQGSSVHGDSPGKNTGVGCHALLQGIFPTQGSNLRLLHCRRILYQLGYQGSLFWRWERFNSTCRESQRQLNWSGPRSKETSQKSTPSIWLRWLLSLVLKNHLICISLFKTEFFARESLVCKSISLQCFSNICQCFYNRAANYS